MPSLLKLCHVVYSLRAPLARLGTRDCKLVAFPVTQGREPGLIQLLLLFVPNSTVPVQWTKAIAEDSGCFPDLERMDRDLVIIAGTAHSVVCRRPRGIYTMAPQDT